MGVVVRAQLRAVRVSKKLSEYQTTFKIFPENDKD